MRALITVLVLGLATSCKEEAPPPPMPQPVASIATPAPIVAAPDLVPSAPVDSSSTVQYAISQLSLLIRGAEGSPRSSDMNDPKWGECMRRFMAVKPVREEILTKLDASDPKGRGVQEMIDATMKAAFCVNCSSAEEALPFCAKARKSIAAAERQLKVAH
jgi:hypothetical protein